MPLISYLAKHIDYILVKEESAVKRKINLFQHSPTVAETEIREYLDKFV
jgi:hypothetical protein